MKRIANTLAALSLTVLFFVASAHAVSGQNRLVAYIPFDFTVGSRLLPAGQYQFERTGSGNNIVLISGAEGHSQFAVPSAAVEGNGTSKESMLTFAILEGRHVLVQIWNKNTDSGVGFAYGHTVSEPELKVKPEIAAATR